MVAAEAIAMTGSGDDLADALPLEAPLDCCVVAGGGIAAVADESSLLPLVDAAAFGSEIST